MEPVSYTFTESEIAEIQRHLSKYPDKRSAVMPALWIAQEKFGWLSEEAIKLVADTIDIPYAHVYGVASFYTMYFKEKVPEHLIEVCTCFTCGEMGGKEMLDYVKEKIGADARGFGKDGKIWARAAECLGACDTAPVCQITNRRYVHQLTKAKVDELIAKLEKGEEIPYERIPLTDQSIIDD
ncbi:MAG: NADH-quinone oxidoreductase subunit E [Bacteroidetes bacterium]|nr:MAG: NADH-quinone oxidoreductase subunit E [Bacteroidota bacterium]